MAKTYTIKWGDTLWDIAQATGKTVQELKAMQKDGFKMIAGKTMNVGDDFDEEKVNKYYEDKKIDRSNRWKKNKQKGEKEQKTTANTTSTNNSNNSNNSNTPKKSNKSNSKPSTSIKLDDSEIKSAGYGSEEMSKKEPESEDSRTMSASERQALKERESRIKEAEKRERDKKSARESAMNPQGGPYRYNLRRSHESYTNTPDSIFAKKMEQYRK